MKSKILFTFLLSFFSIICFAQEIEVTGKVIRGCDGKPIANVRVWAEKGDASTQTDYEGNFTITVDKNDNLNFTKFIYERVSMKANQNKMNVSLILDDNEIDDIPNLLNELNRTIYKYRTELDECGKGRPKSCPTCPECPSSESE